MKLQLSAWVAAVVCATLPCGPVVLADTVTLKSGNAPIGQRDPLITVEGAAVMGHPSSGVPLQNALVVATPGYWCTPPAGSYWVTPNTTAMMGYLYKAQFSLPTNFTNPRLTLLMVTDDPGLAFINGYQITPYTTGFGGISSFSFDNASAFSSGINYLQFHVANNAVYPSPTGLGFSLTVTYDPAPAVPEFPASGLVSIGILSGTFLRRVRRSR